MRGMRFYKKRILKLERDKKSSLYSRSSKLFPEYIYIFIYMYTHIHTIIDIFLHLKQRTVFKKKKKKKHTTSYLTK